MGDGCLSTWKKNYVIQFTGNLVLDMGYYKNYIIPLLKKEFNLDFRLKERKKRNALYVEINNKDLFIQLNNIGFPVGKKGQRLLIPKKLYNLKWGYTKFIVRGLFDTDGCISARKDENYKYPHIIISSISKKLIKQLYILLKNRDYPVWITKDKEEIRIKGIKNTIKWMNDVGSNNDRHIIKYKYWLKNKKLPANLINGPVAKSGNTLSIR